MWRSKPPECEKYKTVIAEAEGPIKVPEHRGKISFPSHLLRAARRSEIKRRFFSLARALISIQPREDQRPRRENRGMSGSAFACVIGGNRTGLLLRALY